MATLVRVIGILGAAETPDGKPRNPGDWVEIKNKEQLRRLIAEGKVEVPHWLAEKTATALVGDNCAVIIRAKKGSVALDVFRSFRNALNIVWQPIPEMIADRVMIWQPSCPLTYQQFLMGFGRLEPAKTGYTAWEMAAMWMGNKTLAQNYGPVAEQEKTKAVTRGELRIPVYDTRLVWVRRTPITEVVIDQWALEIEDGHNEPHGFLRAVYAAGPMINTLPQNWMST